MIAAPHRTAMATTQPFLMAKKGTDIQNRPGGLASDSPERPLRLRGAISLHGKM